MHLQLPAYSTEIVGREREVPQVIDTLTQHRLATIHGMELELVVLPRFEQRPAFFWVNTTGVPGNGVYTHNQVTRIEVTPTKSPSYEAGTSGYKNFFHRLQKPHNLSLVMLERQFRVTY